MTPVASSIDWVAPATAAGRRLIDVVAEWAPAMARPQWHYLIGSGQLWVNGAVCHYDSTVSAGDHLTGAWLLRNPGGIEPEELPLVIVHEDADLLVVIKPAGMAAHPTLGHWRGTLANAVMGYLVTAAARGRGCDGRADDVGDPSEPTEPPHVGLVHRLDRETSGLMVVGKRLAATRALSRQLERRELQRGYIALVWGQVSPTAGVIELPLARTRDDQTRTTPDQAGRPARTRYQVLEQQPSHARLAIELDTGRTHQIRAHFAAIGHPLVGDHLYAGSTSSSLASRCCLHAGWLGVCHPTTNRPMRFEAPPPDEWSMI